MKINKMPVPIKAIFSEITFVPIIQTVDSQLNGHGMPLKYDDNPTRNEPIPVRRKDHLSIAEKYVNITHR